MSTEFLELHEFTSTEVVNVERFNENNVKIDNEAKRQNTVISGLPNTATIQALISKLFKDVAYNAATGVLTFTWNDDTTKDIDLPLELLIEDGYYDTTTKELVLILANMDEIRIPVDDLISEYTADNVTMTLTGTVFSLKAEYKNKVDNTPLFVKLTQAEYDALATKDENTIFCIKEV